jgi:hypothetical protein
MDEEKKAFNIVEIIILMMIAIANDAAEIVFDLLALTGVGLAGEAIMEPINLLVDFIVTPWFFFKAGFGGPAILQLADDLLELVGIPGRTIAVGGGIWIANHPKSKLSKLAQTAAALEGGGIAGEAGALEGEAAAVGELGAGTEAAGVAGEGTEAARGGRGVSGGESGAESEGQPGAKEKSAAEQEAEEKMTPEAEKSPLEVQRKKLFEESPEEPDFSANQQVRDKDEDDEDELADAA